MPLEKRFEQTNIFASNSKYETCHGIELREKENPTSQIPKEWRLG